MYNVFNYWNNRGLPNSASSDVTKKHIEYVSKHLTTGCTVFDYGPGVGRIFPAYKLCKSVSGYDVTESYKEESMKAAEDNCMDYTLKVSDVVLPPVPEVKFDYVVACSVLLHQVPEDISNIVERLAKIGSKVLVVSWFDDARDMDIRGSYQFCYNHDYVGILDKLGLKYVYERFGNQIYLEYWEDKE